MQIKDKMDGGFIAFIVLASVGILVFLIVACICCPICLIAKLVGKRRRGVVYESPANDGTTTTTTSVITQGRRQIVVNVRQPTQRPAQATGAPAVHNAPYPVQAQMPVAPAHHMQFPQYPHYGGTPGYPGPMPQGGYPPSASPAGYQGSQALPDLPPPYPGLSRDNDAFQNQPAYNPHFDDQMENIIAAASRTAGAPPKE